MPDISQLNGFFRPQQLIAAAVLVALTLVVYAGIRAGSRPAAANQRRWLTLIGLDNRVSTSRTVALLWTLVVAYCLITLVFIALKVPTTGVPQPSDTIPPDWAAVAFRPLSSALLLQLGIPVASAVTSQIVVSAKRRGGTLQKTLSQTPATIGQLITDDAGNLDVADGQYVLFNLIAAGYILTQFIWHPGRGIVDIPPVFGALIGGAAAVYLGNKMLASNAPVLDPLITTTTLVGGKVTLTGRNLLGGGDTAGAKIALTSVDGEAIAPDRFAVENSSTDTSLTFTVPALPAGTNWQVTVVTAADVSVTAAGTLRILPPVNGAVAAATALSAKTVYRG